MPANERARPEPCTACGGAVTVVETTSAAHRLGQRVSARKPKVGHRHSDRQTIGDRVDAECNR